MSNLQFFGLEANGFKVGDVVRMKCEDNGLNAWADCLILGFATDKNHDTWVKLARPYCYVSCAGSTSPGVLTGVEEYETTANSLTTNFVRVGASNYVR